MGLTVDASSGEMNKGVALGLGVCGALVVGTVALGVVLGMKQGQAPVGEIARAFRSGGTSTFGRAELIEFFEANYGEVWETLSLEGQLNLIEIFEGKAAMLNPEVFPELMGMPPSSINPFELGPEQFAEFEMIFSAQQRVDLLESVEKLRELAPTGSQDWSVAQWNEWMESVAQNPLDPAHRYLIEPLIFDPMMMPWMDTSALILSPEAFGRQLDSAREVLQEVKSSVSTSLWEMVQADAAFFNRQMLLRKMEFVAMQAAQTASAVTRAVL